MNRLVSRRALLAGGLALAASLKRAAVSALQSIPRYVYLRGWGGFGRGNGHVFNLGHGVAQATPPENVAALVETVHAASRQYH